MSTISILEGGVSLLKKIKSEVGLGYTKLVLDLISLIDVNCVPVSLISSMKTPSALNEPLEEKLNPYV
jgi:hypothetical protein